MAKHGLTELFGQSDEPDASIRRQQAKRLREALEELGPTSALRLQSPSLPRRREFKIQCGHGIRLTMIMRIPEVRRMR
jgi:hypothetical protein